VLLLLRIVRPVIRHCRYRPRGWTSRSIAAVNWAGNRRRARQGETVVNNHIVVPIIMQTIVDIVPIAGMIVAIGDGDGDGNGGGGNDGRGDAACLRRCSDADNCPVCGQRQARWRQRFCGDCHAVKNGSPIKLKPKILILRHPTQY
jgi:hypothetical protein